MAAGSRSKKTRSKSKKVSKTNKGVVASGPRNRFNKFSLMIAVVLFGAVGFYLLAASGALSPDEVLLADDPARGLVYEGKKVKTKGHCAGGFDKTTEDDKKVKFDGKEKPRCAHLDPTPEGIDIRERIKKVDENLAALAAHDAKNKPAASDDTSGYEQTPLATAETISGADMDGIGARDWPCTGTGKDGARVQLIYVYPESGRNRLGALRDGFSAIARRMNSIYFQSGYESGNAHQIRFTTNNGDAGCSLAIAAEGIRGDRLNDEDFIKERLQARGYKGIPKPWDITGDGVPDITTYDDRKFLVWVDKEYRNNDGQLTKCGLGELRVDDSHGQDNANNRSVTYAWAWKGCWNYAEPHELGHMLGAVQAVYRLSDGTLVQRGTPNSTKNHHCDDERDVMCYDDDGNGPVSMRNICTRAIDWWRLDCNHNDYYRGKDPVDGYLSNHWNVANSKYLTR